MSGDSIHIQDNIRIVPSNNESCELALMCEHRSELNSISMIFSVTPRYLLQALLVHSIL